VASASPGDRVGAEPHEISVAATQGAEIVDERLLRRRRAADGDSPFPARIS
jgi:hypothetical protein